MANTKISGLTELTGADIDAENDVIPVVDTSVTTTKKITLDQLLSIPQVSKSVDYTAVFSDANKHILHPTADDNPRTFTIPANASVAYPVGTVLMFVNQINTVTVAITTDTLTLLGSGSTGSRTVAADGMLVALKVASTSWVCAGQGVS